MYVMVKGLTEESVHNVFKEMKILTVYSLYVYETAENRKGLHLTQLPNLANTLNTQ